MLAHSSLINFGCTHQEFCYDKIIKVQKLQCDLSVYNQGGF